MMLKFKLNTPMAGSRYSYVAGDEIPVTKAEAERYKKAGLGTVLGPWEEAETGGKAKPKSPAAKPKPARRKPAKKTTTAAATAKKDVPENTAS